MRHLWTDAEVERLTALYPDTKTDKIAALLGIDIQKVYCKANSLGLKKSATFLSSPESRRLDGKIGSHTRFQKGQTTWNKGMKGLQLGGIATRFKPGNVPHTWQPIGSERVSKDGYLQRKMSNTGYPPRDWVGVHIIVWEAHNGKVPKGSVVVFKDGNKANLDIGNLELITRRDLMARNTIHNYPPEIVALTHIRGRITQQINIRKGEDK